MERFMSSAITIAVSDERAWQRHDTKRRTVIQTMARKLRFCLRKKPRKNCRFLACTGWISHKAMHLPFLIIYWDYMRRSAVSLELLHRLKAQQLLMSQIRFRLRSGQLYKTSPKHNQNILFEILNLITLPTLDYIQVWHKSKAIFNFQLLGQSKILF